MSDSDKISYQSELVTLMGQPVIKDIFDEVAGVMDIRVKGTELIQSLLH